ncbi:MAG: hypothetical protein ACRDMZ_16015, partial [Solirubrobacteraceae bacterium]
LRIERVICGGLDQTRRGGEPQAREARCARTGSRAVRRDAAWLAGPQWEVRPLRVQAVVSYRVDAGAPAAGRVAQPERENR